MREIIKPGRSNILAANGMVATSNPLSSQEGLSILKKGGNAVDAAIAASAVQAVVEPGSTGIGGDCFAIISMNGCKPVAVNGSGIAPKNANLKYFTNNKIKKITLDSPHSVTIPGCIHAWHSMHQKYGKLDFEELFRSAISFSENGFPVHEIESITWQENKNKLSKNSHTKKIFLPNNRAPKFGEIFKNPALSNSLKIISKKGARGFYEGELAKDMVSTLTALGGTHTMEDFLNQKTEFSKTINNKYKDYILHQCPLNGPGIIVLIMMSILEKFNFKNINPNSFERYHIQSEVTKVCYELKETKLGDPKYNNINYKEILSDHFINNLFDRIKFDEVIYSEKSIVTSHPETIYLTAVDNNFNSVSFINSICHAFGSGITSSNSGILFQNRGVNFRLEKNHPNSINSNKRPLHTIIPGLLTDNNNNTLFSFGVMGGQYQPIGQSHILQNIFDFNMTIQEAIDFPRAFCLNNKLILEKTISKEIFEKLTKLGHKTLYSNVPIGGGQGIYIDRLKGVLIGGSDSRKDGLAIGY